MIAIANDISVQSASSEALVLRFDHDQDHVNDRDDDQVHDHGAFVPVILS